MGSEGERFERKPRFLCLHGFRTNGEIMKTQIGKWTESVAERLDLVFLDAPFPARGKSDVEGIFDPPYYEWFQFNKEFTEYTNLEECLKFIEDFMIVNAPFDGLIGFSQGAILSGALPGLQAKGVALTKVPKIKNLIIIGAAKFRSEEVAEKAYSSPIKCPSLHFLGSPKMATSCFLSLQIVLMSVDDYREKIPNPVVFFSRPSFPDPRPIVTLTSPSSSSLSLFPLFFITQPNEPTNSIYRALHQRARTKLLGTLLDSEVVFGSRTTASPSSARTSEIFTPRFDLGGLGPAALQLDLGSLGSPRSSSTSADELRADFGDGALQPRTPRLDFGLTSAELPRRPTSAGLRPRLAPARPRRTRTRALARPRQPRTALSLDLGRQPRPLYFSLHAWGGERAAELHGERAAELQGERAAELGGEGAAELQEERAAELGGECAAELQEERASHRRTLSCLAAPRPSSRLASPLIAPRLAASGTSSASALVSKGLHTQQKHERQIF